MIKKIFDIKPPEKDERVVQSFPEKTGLPKQHSIHLKKILFFGLGLLIFSLGMVVIIDLNSKMIIELTPRERIITATTTVQAISETSASTSQEKAINTQLLKIHQDATEKFSATGEKTEEGKAKGTIRIYNKSLSSQTIVFRAGTRFLSSDGSKTFVSPKKIYIPASYFKNGKRLPGTVDVTVEAVEPGPDYNIGPSKFSVPGLSGDALYYSIYGESNSSFSGGFKKSVKVVSKSDLEKAKQNLRGELLHNANQSLKQKLPKDFVFLKKSTSTESLKISCSQKSGDVVSAFSCQGDIFLEALVFDGKELESIAKKIVLKQLLDSEAINENSLSFHYDVENLDIKKGTATLSINSLVKVYKKIDKNFLKSRIKGESESTMRNIIASEFPEIQKAEIKIFPFWLHSAPKNENKITFVLKLN